MEDKKGAALRRKGRYYRGERVRDAKEVRGRGKECKFTRSVAAIVSPSPVAPENTTSADEEPDEEGDKGTKG